MPDDLAVPRRLHPVTPVLDLVVQARQLAIPFVVLAIGGARGAFAPVTIVLILAAVLGVRVLRWSRFSYRIEGDSLHIEDGILQRTRRTVPLARIQQVDVQRALRHRAAGVAALRIDTAGGSGGAEATLEVVGLDEAARLRRVLLAQAPAGQGPAARAPGPDGGDPGTGAPSGTDPWAHGTDHDPAPSTDPWPPGTGRGPGTHARGPDDPAHRPAPSTDPSARGAGAEARAAGDEPAHGIGTPTGGHHDWGADSPWSRTGGRPGTGAHGIDAGTDTEGAVLLRIPAIRLALGGLTGARLLAVVAVAGSAIQLLDDVPEGLVRRIVDTLPGGATGTLLAVVVGLPLWLAVAAGSAVLTDGGFTLSRRQGSVHVYRGILDQREATVGLHRVQAVRIIQNPARRLLGLAQVQLQSAGSGTSASGDVTRVTVPVVAVGDLDRILAEVMPGAAPLPSLAPAPPAARRRALLRRVAPTALVAGVVAAATGAPALLAGAAVVAAAGLGELAYRGLGHAASPTHLVARRGSLVRETVVVPVARTQSARLRSSPFQRRAGLATLLVDVAGRGRTPAILDGPAERLATLRRQVLVAPGARADEAAVRHRARHATT